jgi:hypothetical protein
MRLFLSLFLLGLLGACSSPAEEIEDSGSTPTDTGDSLSPLEKALETGDPQGLSSAVDLLADLRAEIALVTGEKEALLRGIFATDPISYTPTGFSQHINSARPESVFTLLQGSAAGHSLAAIGREDDARFAAFGVHLMKELQEGRNGEFQPVLERLVAWLLQDDPASELPSTLNVAIAQMGGDKKVTKDWVKGAIEAPSFEVCEEDLEACFLAADLVLVGAAGEDVDAEILGQAVEAALAQGLPVLFLHTQYWDSSDSGERVLKALGMTFGGYGGNYWSDDAAIWDSVEEMLEDGGLLGALDTLYAHFQEDDFDFDWSECTSYVGQVSCSNVPGLRQEFYLGAEGLKGMFAAFDAEGLDLFDQPDRRLSKLALLLADLFRRDIVYPMSKSDADQVGFFEAYYADHVVHYRRDFNPAQPDLGSFSGPLSVADVELMDVSMAVDVSKEGGFTAVGLSTLPGEPFTVRLLDDADLVVGLFLNTQRTGSTREFDEDQYTRPKFLSSPTMWLKQGEEASFVSPFGGTLQLLVSSSGADQTVHLELEGVGQHPVLDSTGEPEAFLAELDGSPFPFCEIQTPYVQIHSKTSMMLDAIDAYGGDIELFFQDLNTYMVLDTYDLAGFVGDGLGLGSEVLATCEQLGWDCTDGAIHGRPKVQHINVDVYAHCGGGCAGNPYDQSWALKPLGWGESHEIGHNLQRGRLMIYEWQSSEVSNQIFPLHKFWSWYQDTGDSQGANRVKNQELFELFQDAALGNDPFGEAYDAIWEDTSYAANNSLRMGMWMQMRYFAWWQVRWDTGWDLFTLMYLHERLFSHAVGDSATWDAQRDGLGFDVFSGASNIGGNDFMLISFSFLTETDQRPFFDLWGVSYSGGASDQVEAYGFPAVPKQMWVTQDLNGNPAEEPLPIDGVTDWPF